MPKSVLVVDDDADWAEIIEFEFEQMGYIARTASDLRSAIKELDKQVFSLVTLDMKLKEGSETFHGELVLDYILKNHKQVKCIIITGSKPPRKMTFGMSRKYPMILDFIEKSPTTVTELKDLVNRICRGSGDTKPSSNATERTEESVETLSVDSSESEDRRKYLSRLRLLLNKHFDEGELRSLCFDLSIDYDDLPGEGKADKARELVSYLERHDRMPDLIRHGRQLRPDVQW